MKTHHLKTWPVHFAAVLSGAKRAELRRNDRDFAVGDRLVLEEWDPDPRTSYTGRSVTVRVTHLLDSWSLQRGYVMLSIAPDEPMDREDAATCSCGARAVFWNPYNKVTQCHSCGLAANAGAVR